VNCRRLRLALIAVGQSGGPAPLWPVFEERDVFEELAVFEELDFYRRPFAILRASGRLLNFSIDKTPKIGPGASIANE
jgi:hypothetical protein